MSELFSKAMTEVVSRARVGLGEAELLKRFRSAGGTYSAFAGVIAEDPELEGNILQIANKAVEGKLQEPITSAAAALSFLGFLPTRNLLAASVVCKDSSLAPGTPEVSAAIKFALQSEQQAKEGQAIGTEFFVAGLVYDALRHIAREAAPAIPEALIEKRLSDLWGHSRAVTLAAVQLSQKLAPELSLERDLALEGMLHDIGRGVFALLAPEKEAAYDPKEGFDTLQAEAKRFGFPHPVYGNLFLSRFRIFKEAAWVCLFHHEPALAKKLGKVLYARTSLLWLAERIVAYRELHGNKETTKNVLQAWNSALRPAVKANEEAFAQAVTQLSL